MQWRQSFALCVTYVLFLVFGAVLFMHIEFEEENVIEVFEPKEWTKLKGLALGEATLEDEDELLVLATWLPRVCPDLSNYTIQALVQPAGPQQAAVEAAESQCPHLQQERETMVKVYQWTFIDALYFAMTVTTTIGYGAHYPVTAWGRVLCMLYALVGIPLTGMLLAWTSEFFGEQLFKLFKAKLSPERQQDKRVIALFTCFYVVAGFVVFIFLPAAVFSAVENWSYLESVYFAFITLTTIGFGDYVTGYDQEGATRYVYQICVILWILVGLGYWVMVANFITKALKSKQLQSSVMRSAEEMKKLMQQMGIKNNDPRFLRQHSKATLNFMLQLSNIIAVQGGVEGEETPDSPGTSTTTSSPPTSPMGIPGISALFGPNMNHASPFTQLIGPLSRRVDTSDRNNSEEMTALTVSFKA